MVEVVVAHDVIGNVMIRSTRAPGIAHVIEQLMGFEGNEFYSKNWPELEHRTFGLYSHSAHRSRSNISESLWSQNCAPRDLNENLIWSCLNTAKMIDTHESKQRTVS